MFGTGLPDIWIPPADAIGIVTRVHPRSPQLFLAADTRPNFLHAAVLVGAPFMPYLVEEVAGGLDRERLATEARRMAETILGLDPRPINAAVRFLPVAFPHAYSDIAWIMISDTGQQLDTFEFKTDLIVPDAYWWQLLGAGHRDRLGGWPQGAEVIDGGEAAVVTFGRPEDWAEPTTAEAVRALARRTLAPIIAHNSSQVFDARRPGH